LFDKGGFVSLPPKLLKREEALTPLTAMGVYNSKHSQQGRRLVVVTTNGETKRRARSGVQAAQDFSIMG